MNTEPSPTEPVEQTAANPQPTEQEAVDKPVESIPTDPETDNRVEPPVPDEPAGSGEYRREGDYASGPAALPQEDDMPELGQRQPEPLPQLGPEDTQPDPGDDPEADLARLKKLDEEEAEKRRLEDVAGGEPPQQEAAQPLQVSSMVETPATAAKSVLAAAKPQIRSQGCAQRMPGAPRPE